MDIDHRGDAVVGVEQPEDALQGDPRALDNRDLARELPEGPKEALEGLQERDHEARGDRAAEGVAGAVPEHQGDVL